MDKDDWKRFAAEHMSRFRLAAAVVVLVVILLVAAGASSVYSVPADSQAVVKRFGAVVRIENPGLQFRLPFGMERATIIPTKRVLKEEFGFRTVQPGERTRYRKTPEMQEMESLMLTGDLNVIDVEWVVQYRITDPAAWMHQVRDPAKTLRDVSEAVMRRIVGNHLGSEVLTVARSEIAGQVREEMQLILAGTDPDAPADDYNLGVHIGSVEMQDVTPPDPVKPAFNEVNKARQERQRLINQAQKKRNQLLPKAQGQAAQTVAEARAYQAERVNAARGEAERFTAILRE